MKDFHDLHLITQTGQVEGQRLEEVVKAVFRHRETALRLPVSFSRASLEEFQRLWLAHSRTLPSHHDLPDQFQTVLDQTNDWLEQNTHLGQQASV